MSAFIQNLRSPIDSLHIALLARKLGNPATAHEFVDKCRDMLEKAPSEDTKGEMSLRIASEIFSHTKDKKVKGMAAATMNMKGKSVCLVNARLAACNTALSMITSPVSGPADSVLCSAALASMKKERGSFIVEAFVPEILKVSNNPSLKTAFDCVGKYAERYSEYSCYGYEAYQNTIEVCASQNADSPELLLALIAARTSRGDRLGHFGCEEISRYYVDEIASITRDNTTRMVAETVSRICHLDAMDQAYFKGSVLYPLFKMLAEVIEQPRQSDNPADVLVSAEKSLFSEWDNDDDSDILVRSGAAKIFEEEIAKARNLYSARETVKEMVEAASGKHEAPEIEEVSDYILIDGVKLEKR